MIKIISGTVIVLVTIAILIVAIGIINPPEYSLTRTRSFDYNADIVWDILTDITQYPLKKKEVVTVEILEKDGRFIRKWRENLELGGYRIYEIKEKEAPKYFVLEMIDSRNDLKGTWTYALDIKEKSTDLIIKEESEQHNIFWRGISVIKGRDFFIAHEYKWIQVGLFQWILHE